MEKMERKEADDEDWYVQGRSWRNGIRVISLSPTWLEEVEDEEKMTIKIEMVNMQVRRKVWSLSRWSKNGIDLNSVNAFKSSIAR